MFYELESILNILVRTIVANDVISGSVVRGQLVLMVIWDDNDLAKWSYNRGRLILEMS